MSLPEFQVKTNKRGYYFILTGKDSKPVFTSEIFPYERQCIDIIEKLKYDTQDPDRYVIKVDRCWKIYFVLRSKDGQIIGKSMFYKSLQELENGIELMKEIIPAASVSCLVQED